MNNKFKLLLLIAVIFILITGAYASLQLSEISSNLTSSNSSESVSQSGSESSRRDSSLISEIETCLICNDTGTLTKTIENYLTCPVCAGTGKTICPDCNGSGGSEFSKHLGTNICPTCQGNGRLTCSNCSGKGYKSETIITTVKCPICKDKVSK